jgi:hypothetical protein
VDAIVYVETNFLMSVAMGREGSRRDTTSANAGTLLRRLEESRIANDELLNDVQARLFQLVDRAATILEPIPETPANIHNAVMVLTNTSTTNHTNRTNENQSLSDRLIVTTHDHGQLVARCRKLGLPFARSIPPRVTERGASRSESGARCQASCICPSQRLEPSLDLESHQLAAKFEQLFVARNLPVEK